MWTRHAIATKQLSLCLALLALGPLGCNSRAAGSLLGAMTKFRPYEVVDARQGGMVASRFAVPQDWKASSRVDWNFNDYYLPVHARARAEAPDGESWVEYFPNEFFYWLSPQPRTRAGSSGGINHPNITLPEALVRYVIVPNRRNAQKLHILGYRPANMPQAFPKPFSYMFSHGFRPGQGICMRVQYELEGAPVDEEFYGYMPAGDAIPSNGPLRLTEYHRVLVMAHSMGARAGKLESARPLLGRIATSIEYNPAWLTRLGEVRKMQMAQYDRVMAQNYANIRAAGEMSRRISAQNDAFIARLDANRAAQNQAQNAARSAANASGNEGFDRGTDGFDQYIRGTEHMQDQNGAVSDQYTNYNYHWTDGYGSYVHTNDPSHDPNKYLSGNYQQMTPVR